MNKINLILSLVFLLFCTTSFAVGVSIVDFQFSPSNLTVTVGTTVTWTNNGSRTHSVTSGTPGSPSGLFDSGGLTSGQTFSRTFTQVGTFKYYCKFHNSMTATITVICSNSAQLLKNTGFESGNVNWVQNVTGIITNSTMFPAHTGSFRAQLNGKGVVNTRKLYQQVSIPSNACSVKLNFYLRVSTLDGTSIAHDKLKVQIADTSGVILKTLGTFSNLNKSASYVKKTYDLLSFKGRTVRITFLGTEDSSLKTYFLVDDVTVNISKP